MKVSVSIPEDDLSFIDQYASAHDVESRSAVVQRAVALLRASELGQDYAEAWAEWDDGDGRRWESVAADGFADAAR